MSAGLSRSARDVVVVGIVAAAAVVGLVLWDGGDSPSASVPAASSPTAPAATVAGPTVPGITSGPSVGPAPPTTVPGGAPLTAAPATAAPIPADVAQLPAPPAGVEIASATPGTRSWNVLASTVATVRDGYLPLLTAAGWVPTVTTPGGADAESYRVTDPAGRQLTVTISQNNADVVVVAAP